MNMSNVWRSVKPILNKLPFTGKICHIGQSGLSRLSGTHLRRACGLQHFEQPWLVIVSFNDPPLHDISTRPRLAELSNAGEEDGKGQTGHALHRVVAGLLLDTFRFNTL